ncbi:hypothetical protein IMCC21224_113408 [Puniceibacterium sp. IMCC21224]|nr:hypothetical protein IMCC21224_113408 [Puniceibacterium sp. IMCC21224]
MIATHSQKGQGMRISDLGQKMHVTFGKRFTQYIGQRWRSYLEASPDLYHLDPKSPDAMVRFVPQERIRLTTPR